MSYYIELLRAKRALLCAAILLGLFLVTTVIVRLSLHGSDVMSWPGQLTGSPTAHVTRTGLTDGSERTVVDDPARRTHAVIVQHPDKSFAMEITEPNTGTSREDHLSMGSMDMNEKVYAGGKMRHVTMTFRQSIPAFDIGVLLLTTLPMGLLVATMLGGVLSKENDGHLELAWTKPVSREIYAAAAFGIDAAAALAAQLATVIAILAACLLFFVPKLTAGADSGWEILLAVAGPFAWYALLNAASASIKRGPGLVIGLGWVAAVLVPSVAHGLSGVAEENAVAAAFHTIFATIAYVDPVTYFLSFSYRHGVMTTGSGFTIAASAAALAMLALGYTALSVLQWRRVEA